MRIRMPSQSGPFETNGHPATVDSSSCFANLFDYGDGGPPYRRKIGPQLGRSCFSVSAIMKAISNDWSAFRRGSQWVW